MPTPLTALTPRVADRLTLVGLGLTSNDARGSGSAGTRRKAETKVAAVYDRLLLFGQLDPPSEGAKEGAVCNGDSGGPSFIDVGGEERQVGVHTTADDACAAGTDERVDVHLEWIEQQAHGDVFIDDRHPPPPLDAVSLDEPRLPARGCCLGDGAPLPSLWAALVVLMALGLGRSSRTVSAAACRRRVERPPWL